MNHLGQTHQSTASTAGFGTGITELQGERSFITLHRDVWAALWEHKVLFLLMPVLAWLPYDVITELTVGPLHHLNRGSGIFSMLLGLTLMSAVTVAVDRLGRGLDLEPLEALKLGFGQIGALIWPTMLAGFISGLCSLFFIIPGLIAMARLSLVIPVVIFEGKRGADALRRSNELVSQCGTARLMAYGLTTYIAYLGLTQILPMTYGLTLVTEEYGVLDSLVSVILGAPRNVLMIGITIGCTMLYNDAVSLETLRSDGKLQARYLWPFGRALDGFGQKRNLPKPASAVHFVAVLVAGVFAISALGFMLYESVITMN